MAAFSVLDADLAARSSEPSEEEARALAKSLNQILDAAERLEPAHSEPEATPTASNAAAPSEVV
jgi:Asp-tRNA(Asn)/Glu-tRNA(Gln) amidotransferase C subunit